MDGVFLVAFLDVDVGLVDGVDLHLKLGDGDLHLLLDLGDLGLEPSLSLHYAGVELVHLLSHVLAEGFNRNIHNVFTKKLNLKPGGRVRTRPNVRHVLAESIID